MWLLNSNFNTIRNKELTIDTGYESKTVEIEDASIAITSKLDDMILENRGFFVETMEKFPFFDTEFNTLSPTCPLSPKKAYLNTLFV